MLTFQEFFADVRALNRPVWLPLCQLCCQPGPLQCGLCPQCDPAPCSPPWLQVPTYRMPDYRDFVPEQRIIYLDKMAQYAGKQK